MDDTLDFWDTVGDILENGGLVIIMLYVGEIRGHIPFYYTTITGCVSFDGKYTATISGDGVIISIDPVT